MKTPLPLNHSFFSFFRQALLFGLIFSALSTFGTTLSASEHIVQAEDSVRSSKEEGEKHLPPTIEYEGRTITPQTYFEYRDSIPPKTKPAQLGSKAEKIHTALDKPEQKKKEGKKRSSDKRLRSVTDFHAVFPFSLERLIPLFTDYENEHEIYRRIQVTRDLTPNQGPMQPHFQEVKTGFKFLGIGTIQHYIIHKSPEKPAEDEFLLKWRLAYSIGGNLYHYYGSWYLKGLSGTDSSDSPRTYLRNYADLGLIDPPGGIKLVYKLFLNGVMKNFFKDIYSAAEKMNH